MLPIDFYFDFASPYGFLAAMQIDALAERAGRTVRWRPFLLGAVYKQVEQSPLQPSAKTGRRRRWIGRAAAKNLASASHARKTLA